ncbi:MAG: hypothetical protein H0T43_07230 [Solirubrobacterales bacterium]|nr:hypothetical protein [Solirubrobacterales bacterium]
MSVVARIAFAVLVCATFGAFFVAQELKSTPPVVQDLKVFPFFSPNQDGRFDRARVSFVLKRSDDVTATAVDRAGDDVRELADSRAHAAGRRLELRWDGTDERGREVPDGTYRIRVNLRRQGRSVQLPRNIVKDTRPPRPRVSSIGPDADKVPRPELLPRTDGRPARVTVQAPGRRREVLVFRTDVRPARQVFDAPVRLDDDQTQWTWDGTVDGRRVAAGTYLVAARSRDRAGNIGTSVALPPRPQFGETLPGRGGITVRYLTAQPSANPVGAGEQTAVAVDSVDANFSWTVRRVGEQQIRSRGRGTKSRVVRFRAPGGRSGLYLFEVRTRTRKVAAPLVVQSQQERDVLVVLPATTWQGRNPVDDDGDGRPDTLDAGLDVRLGRPYVKDGLPDQVPEHEALLLAHLDREGRRYDITTDVALARGAGPRLRGHRGVVLAGDTRWLDGGLARSLRRWVRGGGRLLSVGTGSLRRTAELTPGGRAIDPTLPTVRDLFGARLAPVEREAVVLTNVIDEIDLFTGTEGQFAGIEAFEETTGVGRGASLVAAAAATGEGPARPRNVIVALRVRDGLVIRPGLPGLPARLRDDVELAGLLERAWTLVGRR